MSSWSLLAESPRGFQPDRRFFDVPVEVVEAAPEPDIAEPDPLEDAFERGLAEGEARAQGRCAEQIAQVEARCTALVAGLEAMQKVEADALAERLRQTVLALCEEAVLPLALDPARLADRARKAAAMLTRAQDERLLRLNPEDAVLVSSHLSSDFTILPDPSLERGGLRIDTPDGGVEDGPALWLQSLHEAFGDEGL